MFCTKFNHHPESSTFSDFDGFHWLVSNPKVNMNFNNMNEYLSKCFFNQSAFSKPFINSWGHVIVFHKWEVFKKKFCSLIQLLLLKFISKEDQKLDLKFIKDELCQLLLHDMYKILTRVGALYLQRSLLV